MDLNIIRYVRTLTPKQSARLYTKAFAHMSRYDGYQPYGYDWVTMRMTRPAWYETLKSISAAHNDNIMEQQRIEDLNKYADALSHSENE